MVKRKEESVYTSKGGILTRVISTRLTKLAKYSKAPLILSFPPPLSLLSPPVFSTFAPLLTTSFLFLLSVFFFFFYLPFTPVLFLFSFFFLSLPRPPHPDCVRVTRGSFFQFPPLRATSDFEVSSISLWESLFPLSFFVFLSQVFSVYVPHFFLCLFLILRATVWLGWRVV